MCNPWGTFFRVGEEEEEEEEGEEEEGEGEALKSIISKRMHL